MKHDRMVEMGMKLADAYASMSRDPSSQVGCAILDTEGRFRSGGFNGIPRGVEDLTERMTIRPEKYLWMEHAERNAIFNAAGMGGPGLAGCFAFVTGLPPCARCARAMIQCGIRRVYYKAGVLVPDRWIDDMLAATVMLEEAGVMRLGV
jgi:dCMP deaminase